MRLESKIITHTPTDVAKNSVNKEAVPAISRRYVDFSNNVFIICMHAQFRIFTYTYPKLLVPIPIYNIPKLLTNLQMKWVVELRV